jgi:hypothetical protein
VPLLPVGGWLAVSEPAIAQIRAVPVTAPAPPAVAASKP